MTPPVVTKVSCDIIRQKFRDSQYPDRIANGELVRKYLYNEALKNPGNMLPPEPKGTRSQVIRYTDENRQIVAVVHRYMRPDGTLGASGKADPKRLRIGDIIYLADPDL